VTRYGFRERVSLPSLRAGAPTGQVRLQEHALLGIEPYWGGERGAPRAYLMPPLINDH
jgi:hypothetical protein